ncbi:MAG: LPS export ABC transporter permease LptF [Thermodesulfobacteriota bacterium]
MKIKANTIINRYIFRGMLPPFAINLVFLTFIFLMTQILEITNFIVNHKVSMVTVGRMVIYTMPFFLEFVIPMSVMMAVLLTFLRLSGDNEIVALKAGGISIYRLLFPVAVFCCLGSLLTGFMAIYGLPWGRSSFKTLAIEVATANIDIGIKERTFNDTFEGVVLYVNQADIKNRTLVDIFIEDQRKENIVSTVVAPVGILMGDSKDQSVHLRLKNGTVNQVNLKNKAVHFIRFDTYDISMNLKKMSPVAHESEKDEEEMSLSELNQYLNNARSKNDQYYLALMEYHKKFSLPVACIALGLLGVPLGIQSKSSKRSFGIVLGLIFFLIYYLMLSAGWVFGENGEYPPVIGMWVPNLVMGGIAVFLVIRTANEKPVNLDPLFYLIKRSANPFRRITAGKV